MLELKRLAKVTLAHLMITMEELYLHCGASLIEIIFKKILKPRFFFQIHNFYSTSQKISHTRSQ